MKNQVFHSWDEIEAQYLPDLHEKKEYVLSFIPKGRDRALSEGGFFAEIVFSPVLRPTKKPKMSYKDIMAILRTLVKEGVVKSEVRREVVLTYPTDVTYYWR